MTHHLVQRRFVIALRVLLFLALCSVALVAVGHLIARVTYEMQGPYNYDSPIYWAVGRGILNGLRPYVDLFETKPPGIFLLSALSFWLLDSQILTNIAQGVIVGLMPCIVTYTAWRLVRTDARYIRLIVTLVTLLFSILATLYLANRSGEMQVEAFGAFFTVIFTCIVAAGRRMDRWGITWLSLCIAAAVGFKEPFVLTCLACALLLVSQDAGALKKLKPLFLYPLFFAALGGSVLMILCGYFWPYVSIYLPEMLGNHITAAGPLWQRGFDLTILFDNLWYYNVALASVMLLLVFVHGMSVLFRRPNLLLALQHVFFTLIALYLLALAVGTGGQYYDHHFVFALPGAFALYFSVLQFMRTARCQKDIARVCVAIFIACLFIATFTLPKEGYAERIYWAEKDIIAMKNISQRIDKILDACKIDRYMFIGQNGLQPYAFTKHSPVGPLFLQYEYWMNDARPEFRTETMNNLYTAKFVVLQHYEFEAFTNQANSYLHQHFSAFPWACAQPYADAAWYTFYYRSDAPGVAVKKKQEPEHGAAKGTPVQ